MFDPEEYRNKKKTKEKKEHLAKFPAPSATEGWRADRGYEEEGWGDWWSNPWIIGIIVGIVLILALAKR